MRMSSLLLLRTRHFHALSRVAIAWLTVPAVCILLAACASTGVVAPQVERLTTVQYAPTQVVDVLGAMPTAAFQRIARLRVDDPTGTATRAQLVAELQAAAGKLGANAVVVSSETRAGGASVGFNPAGGQIQDVAGTGQVLLTALAIRYTH